MRRIAIIGCGGAGKSTLARKMGEKLGLKVHHLDRLYWRSDWKESALNEWKPLHDNLCTESEWILDGNYSSTMDVRLKACDTVIFLDFPRLLCLYRVVKRFFKYRGTSRPDMTLGCPERVTKEFLHYIWMYPKARRPGILKKLENIKAEKNVYILTSTQEISDFLAGLRSPQ